MPNEGSGARVSDAAAKSGVQVYTDAEIQQQQRCTY